MTAQVRRAGEVAVGVAAAGTLLVAAGTALRDVADAPAGLTDTVTARLADSGAENAVTAVLLNFRVYDTWLEMLVLLAAAVAILALGGDATLDEPVDPAGPVVRGLAEALLPLIVVISAFILAIGTSHPGGAFQAGAVLAAGLVLLRLGGHQPVRSAPRRLLWIALLAAAIVLLVVAAVPLLRGDALLHLPPERAHATILAVEVAVTLSVAATLALMFAAAPPSRRRPRR